MHVLLFQMFQIQEVNIVNTNLIFELEKWATMRVHACMNTLYKYVKRQFRVIKRAT